MPRSEPKSEHFTGTSHEKRLQAVLVMMINQSYQINLHHQLETKGSQSDRRNSANGRCGIQLISVQLAFTRGIMGDSREIPKKRQSSDDERDGQDDRDELDDGSHQGSTRKRQRVRLSCLECRRRKLSCSRELPCDRCVKSGTPERCTYEARPGGPAATIPAAARNTFIPAESPFVSFGGSEGRRVNSNQPAGRQSVEGAAPKDTVRDHERIRKLELEVAQLRSALGKQSSVDGSTVVASPATTREAPKDTPPTSWCHTGGTFMDSDAITRVKATENGMCFRSRYCGPHNAWSSLKEITGISHFMRETANEWLRPLNIQKKDRGKRRQERELRSAQPDVSLEKLLPTKEETDSLVAVYLDQFEQLHRIVHIPTFRKDYEAFWGSNPTRPASLTALVLSMISVSCCLGMQTSGKFIGVKSSAYATAEKWIKACDAWFNQQSHKHRRLVHYQIECLLYLAKKVNTIKKKRFWVTAGGLVRGAITIGLHQDPDTLSPDLSPYNKEMRRRIWSTIVEFDLQAAFDLGVPTLISQVHLDADPPRNIDDDSFDPNSTEIPISRPRSEYTFSSYAHFSRQSLPARLELYKILTGPPIDLDWEQILQYTDMITHEIDSLPAWDLECDQSPGVSHKPSLAHALLHIQLRQFLMPLHQPFLKLRKTHSRYQTSEFIYYTAARDLVLIHDRLFQKGIRTLYFLREDSISAAMNLCHISLLQPRGSTSLINSNNRETLQLVEKCIALKEDRVLRCGNNDPWGYSSMCAAYGLIETHLGLKAPEAAKAQAAERFIGLHYKLLSYQEGAQPDGITQQTTSAPSEPIPGSTYPPNTSMPPAHVGPTLLHRDGLPLSIPWSMAPIDPSQLLVPNPEFNFELLGSDLNDLWGDWSGTDFV
ncbi:putative C6 zinc finger domain-containing protein [Rosellinia necatrix]|uniref:Putative C6 zinc finger domain-containing protein n=1 Tax=Rosellinia necatrix TaxID=77044 RepID=A0A1W2TCB7_ROSNE|nr:putative C6 zinc finger domain-containing protein [Rosellinia necatrix]